MKSDTPESPRDQASWLAQSLYARRGVLTSLAILSLLALLTHTAWQAYGPSVARGVRFRVTPKSVAITPPPPWVREDPLRVAFASRDLAEGVSILDTPDRLDGPLSAAVESHPWVRRVTSLTKSPPNRITLQVEYRRPLAAVLTEQGLTPTDVDGALLPGHDLNPAYVERLPRIGIASGNPRRPAPHALSAGSWPVEAVAGAAAIVAAFGDHFDEFRLIEAQIDPTPGMRAGRRFISYQLRSAGNTLVIWGAAPGYGPPDEAPFATKLQRLREAVKQHGPIGSVKTRYVDVIDIRRGVSAFRRVALADGEKRVASKPSDAEEASVTK